MKLNLGCGRDVRPGWVNVDRLGGDVTADAVHLPFRDDAFEEVWSYHMFEHLPNLLGAMEEVHRVLAPGGRLHVFVPYGLGQLYNPFHRQPFDLSTLDYFCHESSSLEHGAIFRILECRYHYRLPFKWHLRVHAPRLARLLGLAFAGEDGRIRSKIPLGRREEVYFCLAPV